MTPAHRFLPFLCAIFMACVLTVSAHADETSPARRTAVDSAKAEAAALLKQGKNTDAYDLYIRLLRESPEDDEINYGLARAAIGSARYNQAVMAYERLLEKYPGQALLYKELAHAYMALNDRASADRAMAAMHALDRGASVEETEALLEKLEARYDRLQIHGRVRAGLMYDTNANFGPSNSIMDLGSWRIYLPDASAKHTMGAYLGGDVNVAWKVDRDSPWWLVADAQGYGRYNINSELDNIHNRYSEWGRFAFGMRRLTPETLLDMRFKGEIFDYEFYQNVKAAGPEVTWLWAVAPSVHLITRANIDRRAYSDDTNRNGYYGSIGQFARVYFGQENHEVLAGLAYTGADASHHAYGYNGWEGHFRLNIKLPNRFELSPFVMYSREWYKGPATALETKKRDDEKTRIGATLTYRITDDWSAELMYQHIDTKSTSALYKYDQDLVTLGVAWNF